jgi:hypothetical protein
MNPETLTLLHEHYRDTCGMMQDLRKARDRYFYLTLLVLGITLFDVAVPADFATTIADVLRARLALSTAPNLAYVRCLLWFLLLGLTIRYGQSALAVERQYNYVHDLEAELAAQVGKGFRREGDAYLKDYPLFLSWAHYLYSLVFPLVLSVVVVVWTWQQIPGPPWPFGPPWSFAIWFNTIVTTAILVSIGLYLHAFHRRRQHRHPPGRS